MLKLHHLLFVVFMSLMGVLSAQEPSLSSVDSLEQLLKATDNKFQEAYIIADIARAASGIDSIKAYEYAKQALHFFEKSTDSFGLAKAHAAMGFVVFDYHEMQKSEFHFGKAKELFRNQLKRDSSKTLVDLWADTALNYAASLGNQGKHDEEVLFLTELAPIVKKYKNHKILGIINSNIAITFFNNDNLTKAYSYFKGNETNYEKTTAFSQFAIDRLIFSSCLMEMDSLQTAKKVLDHAYRVLEKTPESPRWNLYYQQLGEYYSKTKNYAKALEQYDQSVKIILERKTVGSLPQQYLQYIETYALMGNTQKEKEYMLKFYAASKKEHQPDALYALKELAKYENNDRNFAKAMEYANAYFILNDSIKKEEIEKETARLEQRYQKEKRDREILELRTKNSETDLHLERKKSQNYLLFFLVGTLAFLSLSGYLTYRNRQKKAQLKAQLQGQEIQHLKVQQERRLFEGMMEGVEKERKRLAADLHDGLGGRLSGISIKLSKLSEEKEARKIEGKIEAILGNLDDSLQELRGVARNLMPETLIKYGLKSALEDYCSTLRDKDTDIVLQFYEILPIQDENKLLMVYRIIQELINNAVKHANAREILVQYMHQEQKIAIAVEDDGIGFDIEKIDMNEGIGLTSLRNRVNYLNGSIDIQSEINDGTSINIQITEI